MTGFPARLLAVGIGVESDYGTAADPATGVPVTSFAATDQPGLVADESWRGSAAASYGHQLATTAAQLTLGGPVLADVIGYPFAGILGDLTPVGTAAPIDWTMAQLNTTDQQPHSYTITVGDPAGQLAYAGARFSTLAISAGPGSLMTWTAEAAARAGVASAVTQAAMSSLAAIPGWRGTITIGGTATALCTDFALSLSRAVAAKRNTDGQIEARTQRGGLLAVSGRATLVADGDTYRALAVAGTSTSMQLAVSQGSGSTAVSLTARCSLVYLTQAVRTYGADWIEVDVEWTADANLTDAGASGGLSPITVSLSNAVTDGTY